MATSTKRKRPTIYIEASTVCRPQPTGVGQWVEGLLKGLVKALPEVDFVFFHFEIPGSALRITGKNVSEKIITGISPKLFRLRYVLGLAPSVESLLGVDTVDTIIFPEFYAWPVRTKHTRIVSFVPDTTYLDVPQYVPHFYFRRLLKAGVKRSMAVSDKVVVCSQATRRSLQHHYGHFIKDIENIIVAYPGYESPKLVREPVSFDIPESCILFVGTLEPRKNIANLVRGYALLPQKLRDSHPLILAGGKGWLDDEITKAIEAHTSDGVRAVGYVSTTEREALYSAATVFAYPVHYEGFGMPVVEAQAHGVPVLATNNSSLPEATGGEAVYCEPSPESIAAGLEKLLADKSLCDRLSKAGRRHAATFTWQAGQAALTAAIRDILAR